MSLLVAVLVINAAPARQAEAATFIRGQTGPTEWTYTLTFHPLDNYAVCPAPDNIATLTLTGVQGVVSATAPSSTDFPAGSLADTVNLLWNPVVSDGGTVVTWTHVGPGTGNYSVEKHVFGFKVYTATPAVDGPVNIASDGISFDVSVSGPCPVVAADDRDFSLPTSGPVGALVLNIGIDIAPGDDLNTINCDSEKDVVPAAILTTVDFDATSVDHATVAFDGASETHVTKAAGEPRRHEEDVDADGDTDLVLHFQLEDTNLNCDSTEGTLTGLTFDGQSIVGMDAAQMVGGGG